MAVKRKDVKKAVKKAAKKSKVEKVVPLSQFEGWDIHRDKTYIEFGCGAVRVRKADLQELLKAQKENPQLIKALGRIVLAAEGEYDTEDIFNLKERTILGLIG